MRYRCSLNLKDCIIAYIGVHVFHFAKKVFIFRIHLHANFRICASVFPLNIQSIVDIIFHNSVICEYAINFLDDIKSSSFANWTIYLRTCPWGYEIFSIYSNLSAKKFNPKIKNIWRSVQVHKDAYQILLVAYLLPWYNQTWYIRLYVYFYISHLCWYILDIMIFRLWTLKIL